MGPGSDTGNLTHCITTIAINVIQAIWTCRNKETGIASISPNCAMAMDSNSCYAASNVKQTEAQEQCMFTKW